MIAFFHGLLVMILFGGVFFALFDKLKNWPTLEKIYLTAAVLMIISFIFTGGCFLTSVEQWLWQKANSSSYYSVGFISHYLGFVGIRVADETVYWILVFILILGLGCYILRHCWRYCWIKLPRFFGRSGR